MLLLIMSDYTNNNCILNQYEEKINNLEKA